MSRFVVCLFVLLLAALAVIPAVSADQVLEVITPESLRNQFPNGVTLRPALFGFPAFGASMTGYLLYITSNPLGCTRFPPIPPEGEAPILLVDRGNCTFVTKVRHAQMAGAKAVVIVDNIDEPILPYMADDGTGADVEIPSVLIHKSDGAMVKSDLAAGLDVQMAMIWSVPNNDNIVELDIWTSSNVQDSTFTAFKKNFLTVATALGYRLYVEPHYYIIDGIGRCNRPGLPCGSQCIMNGRYCAADPELDLNRGLDGADVVIENLRQLCLWQYLNATNQSLLWWKYVNEFERYCALNEQTWTATCSNNIITGLGIAVGQINNCIVASGGTTGNGRNTLLDLQISMARERGIFIIPTIAINNAVYRGSTYCPAPVSQDHCGVFQAVCAGYSDGTRPNACIPGCNLDLVSTCGNSDQLAPSGDTTSSSGGGVSVGAVIGIVIGALVIAGLATVFFVRRQQRRMRQDFDAILQSYMPIDDPEKRGAIKNKNKDESQGLMLPDTASEES